MQEKIDHPKGKIYYTMGEVCEMFDVRPSLIRFWEEQFDILKPHRNKKGNRLFTPQDVDNLRIIYHLLKEKKMKIEVARKYIKEHKKEVNRDAEIVEKLVSIRAMLQQIKQELQYGASEDGFEAEEVPEPEMLVPKGRQTVSPQADPGEDSSTADRPLAQDAPKEGGNAAGGQSLQDALFPVPTVPDMEGSGLILSESGEFRVTGEVLTVSDLASERDSEGQKPPFVEQVLFEVVSESVINTDVLIETFIENTYDESDDSEKPDIDPFASVSATLPLQPADNEKPKQNVIEQTLF